MEFLTARRAFIDLVEEVLIAKEDAERGRQLHARASEAAGRTGGGRR